MRFHKPVGILLLWFPTAWGLWLANFNNPPIRLVIYLFLGTIIMRAAGCVVNDLADRNIDKHVSRTKMRPITTGEISVKGAIIALFTLLILALLIVLQLPILCLYYSFVALAITIIYPFCKRFLEAPQLVLGLAFSMGIPIAYAASGIICNKTMLILLGINFLWIVAYDTMYALVDKEDDLRIGVKSTAVFFERFDRLIIMILQISFHLLWLYLGLELEESIIFYSLWFLALLVLIYQHYLLKQNTIESSFKAFSSNVWYGFMMWVALI